MWKDAKGATYASWLAQPTLWRCKPTKSTTVDITTPIWRIPTTAQDAAAAPGFVPTLASKSIAFALNDSP